jgi:hypothetical protein
MECLKIGSKREMNGVVTGLENFWDEKEAKVTFKQIYKIV